MWNLLGIYNILIYCRVQDGIIALFQRKPLPAGRSLVSLNSTVRSLLGEELSEFILPFYKVHVACRMLCLFPYTNGAFDILRDNHKHNTDVHYVYQDTVFTYVMYPYIYIRLANIMYLRLALDIGSIAQHG